MLSYQCWQLNNSLAFNTLSYYLLGRLYWSESFICSIVTVVHEMTDRAMTLKAIITRQNTHSSFCFGVACAIFNEPARVCAAERTLNRVGAGVSFLVMLQQFVKTLSESSFWAGWRLMFLLRIAGGNTLLQLRGEKQQEMLCRTVVHQKTSLVVCLKPNVGFADFLRMMLAHQRTK